MRIPPKLKRNATWLIGLAVTLAVIVIPLVLLQPRATEARDNPAAGVPTRVPETDHTNLLRGPYASGPEVTAACLQCHEEAASDFMKTTHWTWESAPEMAEWRGETVTIGKKNQINNFCISAQGNENKCMGCHAGYGWEDDDFDFTNPLNVDCLVCHADRSLYGKGDYGYPLAELDLVAAARSVGLPTRENCGFCHYDGGGGNNVKHGDMDSSLNYPSDNLDVHMGRLDLKCIDCHQGPEHAIKGRLLANNLTIPPDEQVQCTDCHASAPHQDQRINQHTSSVACQTCHIPIVAVRNPTKMTWDWSTSGCDCPEDPHTYLKIKGNFLYVDNVIPTYSWFNGSNAYRYILGDTIDPGQPTMINLPDGDIADPNAKIYPFKVHVAKQPYDTVHNILLAPRTAGEDGYWTTFDWPSGLALGAEDAGIPFSGQYDFAETWMYWPIAHMVQPAEDALQCEACHRPDGRMDWKALGYNGDPIEWGSRAQAK
jgi:octaheme c-type cytochrome (tetrathionate reductase family)